MSSSSSSVILEGYLSKQGHIFQSWNRRYFILTPVKLLYYTDQTLKKLKGEYIFTATSYIQRCESIDQHIYLLKLHAEGTGGTELLIEASTEEILLLWQEKINNILLKHHETATIQSKPSSRYQIHDTSLLKELGISSNYEFVTTLKIKYNDQFLIDLGMEYLPTQLQSEPIIHFETLPRNPETHYLSLFLIDLDSPSPSEPLYRDFLHWGVINITHYVTHSGETILPYLPPCPPYYSNLHRFVFLLFRHSSPVDSNSTSSYFTHRYPLNVMKWASLCQFTLVGLHHMTCQWDESVDMNLSRIHYVPPLQYRSPDQVAVYQLPLQDSLSMAYLGSVISAVISTQLRQQTIDSTADCKTLYEIVSTPFLQSLLETGYYHSSNIIQSMQSDFCPTIPLTVTHKRIQCKFQRLSQYLISPSNCTAQISREYYAEDWTHAEFFLFLPIVTIRFFNTPQIYSTIQQLTHGINGTFRSCLAAGSMILGRLLERCLLKKCLPIIAMKSFLHSDNDNSNSTLSTLERQFLTCSLSDEFYLTIVQIYEILSSHPSYPTISLLTTNESQSLQTIYQDLLEIRGLLLLELIQNNHIDHFSIENCIDKLSSKHRELWEECKLFKSNRSIEQHPELSLEEKMNETLCDLSSQSNCNLGTILCLLYILKTSQSFEDVVNFNLKIGGDVDLRSPLCGSFYAAAIYPLSSSSAEEHHWSSRAIPPMWIRSIPESTIKPALDSIKKILAVRQRTLIIGATGKIGSSTLKYLCSQYSSETTPVAGIRNLQSSESMKLSELSTRYNLLLKEANLSSSDSIFNCIDQDTHTVFLVTPTIGEEGINLTIAAINTCLQSSHVKHLIILSMICPIPLDTNVDPPHLIKLYHTLESHFITRCDEMDVTHTIIRIPPIYYTESSFFILKMIESIESQKLFTSLFLSSTLTQKYPFVTLDDIGRGIARILTFSSSDERNVATATATTTTTTTTPTRKKRRNEEYNLYGSSHSDGDALPILSQLWNDGITYQPIEKTKRREYLEHLAIPDISIDHFLDLLEVMNSPGVLPKNDLPELLLEEQNNTKAPCTLREYLTRLKEIYQKPPSPPPPPLQPQPQPPLPAASSTFRIPSPSIPLFQQKIHEDISSSSPSSSSSAAAAMTTPAPSSSVISKRPSWNIPSDSIMFQGRWALKKLITESKYKKRFIWIDVSTKSFYWSKVEGKDSKNKSLLLDSNAGVMVTSPVYFEPKEQSLLQSAMPGGAMWSITDGRGGSINIKFQDEDVNFVNSPALSQAKEWIRIIEKILNEK